MWADRVVDGDVLVDLLVNFLGVDDFVAVEVLVLQRLAKPLDDAVGLLCVVPGSDVGQLVARPLLSAPRAGSQSPCRLSIASIESGAMMERPTGET